MMRLLAVLKMCKASTKAKKNILKITPLTMSAVYSTPLQLQSAKHVVNVVNDKVATALRLGGTHGTIGTANFLALVMRWWKIVNV